MDWTDTVFYPQDLFGDLSSWAAGAENAVIGTISDTAGQALQVVENAPDTLSGAATGTIQQVETYAGDASAGVQQGLETLGSVGQQIEQNAGGVVSIAASPVIQQAQNFVSAVSSGGASAIQATQSIESSVQAAISNQDWGTVAALRAAQNAIALTAAPTLAVATAVAPVAKAVATKVITAVAPLVAGPLESVESAAAPVYSLGVTAVAGVAKFPAEAWDVGWNSGLGQSAANEAFKYAYNTGTEAKNVVANVLAGKSALEGISSGTIVNAGPTKESPSNLAGTVTQTIVDTAQAATGVPVDQNVIKTLVTPGAEKLVNNSNIVAKAIGTGEILGSGVLDWIVQNPVQAEAGLSILPFQIAEVAEPYIPGAVNATAPAATQKSSTKIAPMTITKYQYRVAQVSSKSQCIGKPVGTAGCP